MTLIVELKSRYQELKLIRNWLDKDDDLNLSVSVLCCLAHATLHAMKIETSRYIRVSKPLVCSCIIHV